MTAPNPGDQASWRFGGTVRNDASLGLVVDWTTPSGGSGSAQLAQLPPPVDITPQTYQRDATIASGPGTTEPTTTQVPLGAVGRRSSPTMLLMRLPAGWRLATANDDRAGLAWADLPAANWKLIWVGP